MIWMKVIAISKAEINSKSNDYIEFEQFRTQFLITMLWFWTTINSNRWRLFRTNIIFEQKQLQMCLEVDLKYSFREIVLNVIDKSKWIYRSKFNFDILQCKIFSSLTISSTSSRKNQSFLLLITRKKFSLYSYKCFISRMRFHLRRKSNYKHKSFVFIENRKHMSNCK